MNKVSNVRLIHLGLIWKYKNNEQSKAKDSIVIKIWASCYVTPKFVNIVVNNYFQILLPYSTVQKCKVKILMSNSCFFSLSVFKGETSISRHKKIHIIYFCYVSMIFCSCVVFCIAKNVVHLIAIATNFNRIHCVLHDSGVFKFIIFKIYI